MATYNVASEQAEKLAVRVSSIGGASAIEGERGVYLLKPPASVTATATTITTQTATITAASVSGSGPYTFTYTATNTFVPGQLVTVTGITTATGFNVSSATVVTANATTFTVSNSTNTNTTTPGFSGSSLATPVAIGANTYYYYVTRVSNGVESFSNPVTALTVAGTAASISFAVTDQTANVINPLTATSFNLYIGTTAANATKQSTTGTTTLVWPTYATSGLAYSASPAVVAYPESATAFAAYQSPNWVTDALVHNPNSTTGYSGYPVTGVENQVRQIRTQIAESQTYSRTDTATVKFATIAASSISTNGTTWTVTNTHNFAAGDVITISGVTPTAYNGTYTVATISTTASFTITNSAQPGAVTVAGTAGCNTVADTSITWADFGKPVTGTGIPTNAYVGNVVQGTGFALSAVQGQNVPYVLATTNPLLPNAAGASITVTGSNVGPVPVQVGQYRTSRWQG